ALLRQSQPRPAKARGRKRVAGLSAHGQFSALATRPGDRLHHLARRVGVHIRFQLFLSDRVQLDPAFQWQRVGWQVVTPHGKTNPQFASLLDSKDLKRYTHLEDLSQGYFDSVGSSM